MKKLGIIAGSGKMPLLVVEACRKQGRPFFLLGLNGHAKEEDFSPDIPQAWIRLGAVGKGFSLLKENQVEEVVLIGAVKRPNLVELRPDLKGMAFFAKTGVKALGDDGLLRAVMQTIEEEGFHLVGAHEVLPKCVSSRGVYGKIKPSKDDWEDISKGYCVAKALGDADVGQGCIVADGLVLGVEAIEGTDALIERCQKLHRKGTKGVLVKVKKPQQEEKLDLPTIGVKTVENAAKYGLKGIAVEAGSAFVVDKDEVIKTADKLKIFVVGVDDTCVR